MVKLAGKFLALVLLASPLAGCFDATIDVAVTSATTARLEATQVINADTYGVMKRSAEEDDYSALDEFCTLGEIIENADGGATCSLVKEGDFATLRSFDDEGDNLTFTPEADGAIRVSLSTASIVKMAQNDEELGEETLKMVEAFLAGHTLTIRIGGGEITDTNLTLAKDKESAEAVFPLLDLLVSGKVELPPTFYAVVRPK